MTTGSQHVPNNAAPPAPRTRVRFWLARAAIAAVVFALAWFSAAAFWHLAPSALPAQMARVVVAPIAGAVYAADSRAADATVDSYFAGERPADGAARASWEALGDLVPGLTVTNAADLVEPAPRVPFVYETSTAQFLAAFRQKYGLDAVIAGAPDEYSAMLKLGEWAGTRFDHGTDLVPGGDQVCDPERVVETGKAGARYWCEIAARLTVHAANAVGWQARIITGSRDGYTWEHAVAELWSNQFDKWFVVDADFNVVYESQGVPLSAFELSSRGPQLQRSGLLRVRDIAPVKQSLPRKDVLPYYEYVHVDLRTDWCTRKLRAGSPASGDRATWWWARPTLPRILTAKVRVDDPTRFDWHVNTVTAYALGAARLGDGTVRVTTGLHAYSPAHDHFEVSVDGGWRRIDGARFDAILTPGAHTLAARVVTRAGSPGPATRIELRIPAGG